jgi:predicted DNA-binding ribbon-helix-helix protein
MKSDATIPDLRAYVMAASSPLRKSTFAFKLGSPSARRPEGQPRSAPTGDADEPPKTSSRQINGGQTHRLDCWPYSLEDAFWQALKEIASERGMTPPELIRAINSERQRGNLSSAIRLFVLDFYRQQIPLRKRPGRKG